MRKKMFISLSAVLLLLIGAIGGVSAQSGLKLDGQLNSGLGIVLPGVEDADPFMKAFTADAEHQGLRFRLNGAYVNEAENAGVNFRFQTQGDLSTWGYFTLNVASGWVSFFDGKLRLTGGIVEDYSWQVGDYFARRFTFAQGLGGLVRATPIEGLRLGFGVFTASRSTNGGFWWSQDYGGTNASPPAFGTIRPELNDVRYTLHAGYTMPDVFRADVSFRFPNKAGGNGSDPNGDRNDTTIHFYNGHDEDMAFLAGFRFLGVSDLTAAVSFFATNLQRWDENGLFQPFLSLGYKMGDINVGLDSSAWFYSKDWGGKDAKPAPSAVFIPWASYAIGNVVPRLDLYIFPNGSSALGGSESWNWHRVGYVNRANRTDGNNDQGHFLFGLRPSVKINVDSRAHVEFGAQINMDFAENDYWNKKGGFATPDTDSRTSAAIFVDFKWVF